jgi:hypothetical protein
MESKKGHRKMVTLHYLRVTIFQITYYIALTESVAVEP